MRIIGYLLGYLSGLTVSWFIPLFGLVIMLPLFQLIYTLQPIISVLLIIFFGFLLIWWEFSHNSFWQGILWFILWFLAIVSIIFNVFHIYAIIIEMIVIILLFIPGLVVKEWVEFIRWFAVGEIIFSLILLTGSLLIIPKILLLVSILFFLASFLIGTGAYRPYEIRRMRRLISRWFMMIGLVILFWEPIISQFIKWLSSILNNHLT